MGGKKMQVKNGSNMKACKYEDLWIIDMMHYVSTFTNVLNLLIKCYDTFRVYS